uniref:Uncharacterized protein n=1 Tax=Amphimedon queenslandica TaxID=400682 RepID=A0A1X7TLI9_AMPQE
MASWFEKSFRYCIIEEFLLNGGLFSLKNWGNELIMNVDGTVHLLIEAPWDLGLRPLTPPFPALL